MAQTVTVMKDAVKEFENHGGKAEPLPKEAVAFFDGPVSFPMSHMWRMMSRRCNDQAAAGVHEST